MLMDSRIEPADESLLFIRKVRRVKPSIGRTRTRFLAKPALKALPGV